MNETKQKILSDLKEIKEKVDQTVPFNAFSCKYEWGTVFDIQLKINEEQLQNDQEVEEALTDTMESFAKLIEYHASNFVKIKK